MRLPADSTAGFLDRAVRFPNDRLAGTLATTVLLDPATQQTDPSAIDRTVAGLRYGAVVISTAPTTAAALGSTTWGAYPGYIPDHIDSGVGKVLNSYLLPDPQRCVVTVPQAPL